MGRVRNERGSSDGARGLLVRGIAAAKAGDREEARFYLEWVLLTNAGPDERAEAWLWLSEIADTPEEKRHFLEEILGRNPAHARARRKLALLDGRLQGHELVDPEQLPPHDGEPRPFSAGRHICPRCASPLVYQPDGQSLSCEHCGYRHLPGAGEADGVVREEDFIVALATSRGHLSPAATQTFSCQSCAASFMLGPQTLSITCPYCGATYTASLPETRELVPPEGIIPFSVSGADAEQAARRWLAGQGLRPFAAVHGIYLPLWTFDVGGAVHWRGESDEYEGMTGRRQPASGQEPVYYDAVPVPACHTVPAHLQAVFDSFDLQQTKPFEATYLAAWPAQTYQIAAADASLLARRYAFRRARLALQRRRDLDAVRFSSAGIAILAYKLLLVPVWLGQYRHRGREDMVAVNGQTGRIFGRPRPAGWWQTVRRWLRRRDHS